MKTCPACTRDPEACFDCFDCRELNRPRFVPDLSDAHVDRVARRLFRAFDDASRGREPLHDFDVMAECEYEGRPIVDNWRALAREAIQLGAVVRVEETL